MKITAIVAAFLALASTANTQPASAEFVINATLLAANPQAPGSIQVLARPTLRTSSGRPATLTLGDDANSISIAVTPSDLGAGKVGLHVAVEARLDGRLASSTFDLLTGQGASAATVALRAATGAFMLDKQGRLQFVTLEATRQQ